MQRAAPRTSVVIADDHRDMTAALVELCRAEPGWRVLGTAGTGHDLLALVRRARPALVITDVNMPGGGEHLVHALRHLACPPTVVVYSALADGPAAHRLRANGAAAVLRKGVDDPLAGARRVIGSDAAAPCRRSELADPRSNHLR